MYPCWEYPHELCYNDWQGMKKSAFQLLL